ISRSFAIPTVLVTHDFEDIVRSLTDLFMLQSGHVVASGSIRELTSRAALPWLRDRVSLGSVIDATVVRAHESRGLAELDIGGHVLLAPARQLGVGAHVRIRIPAREVILATEAPQGLSLHNMLHATVSTVQREPGLDQVV